MKVREMIQLLQAVDPEALVMVDGYEGGLDDAGAPQLIQVSLNTGTDPYCGPHDEIESWSSADKKSAAVTAVKI